mgnify:CR=1 FL=1
MRHVMKTTKKKIASLMALMLTVRHLSGPALASELPDETPVEIPEQGTAEQTIIIPDSDYIYVNGSNKVFTAEGDMSVLMRLTVVSPGRVHILTSGVDMSLVIYDEAADEVRGVYTSEEGLMDASFDASAGTYLLGFSGWGEAAVMAADEEKTAEIFAESGVQSKPAAEAAEADSDAEEAEEQAAEASEEEAAAEAEPFAPVAAQSELNETVSVLGILTEAGASVRAVYWAEGDMEGRIVRAPTEDDLLLTPYVYFNELTLTVRAIDASGANTEYTLLFSCPDPADAGQSDDLPAEETQEDSVEKESENTEQPPVSVIADFTEATETGMFETSAETPDNSQDSDEIIEAADEDSADASEEETLTEPEETTEEVNNTAEAEETAEPAADEASEQPEESAGKEKTFLSGFVDWLTGTPDHTTEETPADEEVTEETEQPVEETADKEDETEAPAADEAEQPNDEAAEEESDEEEQPAEEEETSADSEEATDDINNIVETEETTEPAADETAGQPEEEPKLEEEEQPSDEEQSASMEATEESGEEAETFDPSVPIEYVAEHAETFSVLSVLTEAGAPVNVITTYSGEAAMEGKVAYVYQSGDLLLTPFNYFEDLELTVTATDYLAENPEEAEAAYTVIISNPDPNPAPEEEEEEEEEPVPMNITIAMERADGNEVRLFAEDLASDANAKYAFQWQASRDNELWFDVDGANDSEYAFTLDSSSNNSYWRLVITEKESPEGAMTE